MLKSNARTTRIPAKLRQTPPATLGVYQHERRTRGSVTIYNANVAPLTLAKTPKPPSEYEVARVGNLFSGTVE